MKQTILITFLSFFFGHSATGQTILTLEEAIDRALSQNFGIKVLQNDVKILSNNAVKANAGFLPNDSNRNAFSGLFEPKIVERQ
jgi:outer membrane protein TolC